MNEVQFGYRDAPVPFRFYHVGMIPLHEALVDAEPLGQEKVIGRTCNNFHFKEVGPSNAKQSLVYSLDEATSLPLKIGAYASPDRIRSGAPSWVWEATTLDEVSGRHYPLASKYSTFRVTQAKDGRCISEPALSKVITVKEITFDAAIAKATFWPTIEPGVNVWDSIAKRQYRAPGAVGSTREAVSVGQLIRVAPQSGWWLPGVGIALSLAVLGAAILWKCAR